MAGFPARVSRLSTVPLPLTSVRPKGIADGLFATHFIQQQQQWEREEKKSLMIDEVGASNHAPLPPFLPSSPLPVNIL